VRQESTEAAGALDITYTEADDFSTSEEDEPDQAVPSASESCRNIEAPDHDNVPGISPPLHEFVDRIELISLLHLHNTLARHILSDFLKDCVVKWGSPGWFWRAQSILRLTPAEKDWMEDNRLHCLGGQGPKETVEDEVNTWHYAMKQLYRLERETYLDQDPEKALLWLEEDYKDWFCTKDEVKNAILYLVQRGYSLKMAEDLNFGQFLEIESDDDSSEGDSNSNGNGDEMQQEDSGVLT